MQHLHPWILSQLLGEGRSAQQFLGKAAHAGETGVRWAEVRGRDARVEVWLHERAEGPGEADDPESLGPFRDRLPSVLIGEFPDPATALTVADEMLGTLPNRWMERGRLADDYQAYVRDGRPDFWPPDGARVAEILFLSGAVRYSYSRYLSHDGTTWINHGRFREFHDTGQLASEGWYEHGLESGAWQDFHSNGQPAARGDYEGGRKRGLWRYWREDGTPLPSRDYDAEPEAGQPALASQHERLEREHRVLTSRRLRKPGRALPDPLASNIVAGDTADHFDADDVD